MEIDIVYTWVNGSDPEWINKKQRYTPFTTMLPKSHSIHRYQNNDELKYSLRSIEKFAPWVRKIFIVTDSQIPDWLNINNPKIKIIDHKDIFPDINVLPVFNSMAISSCIHRIKDLAAHYIYFNDDVFLGRPMKKHDFFVDNKIPRVFVAKNIPIELKKAENNPKLLPHNFNNEHHWAIINSRKLIFDKYGFTSNKHIRHGPMPLIKEKIFEIESIFKDEIEATRKSRFRSNKNVLMIRLYYLLAEYRKDATYDFAQQVSFSQNESIRILRKLINYIRGKKSYLFRYHLLSDKKDINDINSIKKFKPHFFCINSEYTTTTSMIDIATSFLDDYFPSQSCFEVSISDLSKIRNKTLNRNEKQ